MFKGTWYAQFGFDLMDGEDFQVHRGDFVVLESLLFRLVCLRELDESSLQS